MSIDRLIHEFSQDGNKVQIVEKNDVKELYIDGVQGAMLNSDSGIVKLSLYTQGFVSDSEQNKVERREIQTRLVCSASSLLDIANFFSQVAENIRNNAEENEANEENK